MSTENRYKLIVFDLDYTLWPYWIDSHGTPPFSKNNNNSVVDRYGQKMGHYPDVLDILKNLQKSGYTLGIASRTGAIEEARALLKALEWTKYFNYMEIFPGTKTTHFQNLKRKSGMNFDQMVFFDDEMRNIKDVSGLGVHSVLVRNGVTNELIQDALLQ